MTASSTLARSEAGRSSPEAVDMHDMQTQLRALLEAAGMAPPDGGYPTLPQAHAEWMLSLQARSPRTVRTFQTGYNVFCRFLLEVGMNPKRTTTETITEPLVEQECAWLIQQYGRDSVQTLRTYQAAVSSFCRFLVRRRYSAPGFRIDRMKEVFSAMTPRVGYKTPRVDVDGIARVVITAIAAKDPVRDYERKHAVSSWQRDPVTLARDRALLAVLFNTGMRRGEVVTLNRSEIRNGVAPDCLITGKGSKERRVFFDFDTRVALREYLALRGDRYEPVFIRLDQARESADPGPTGEGWRLNTQSVWKIAKKHMRAAGIEKGGPHAFRHVKACLMLNAGADLSQVQDFLGHSSPEITKRIYAQYSPSKLREAARVFNVRPQDAARVWSGDAQQ